MAIGTFCGIDHLGISRLQRLNRRRQDKSLGRAFAAVSPLRILVRILRIVLVSAILSVLGGSITVTSAERTLRATSVTIDQEEVDQ